MDHVPPDMLHCFLGVMKKFVSLVAGEYGRDPRGSEELEGQGAFVESRAGSEEAEGADRATRGSEEAGGADWATRGSEEARGTDRATRGSERAGGAEEPGSRRGSN
jgi:hypothetical protein